MARTNNASITSFMKYPLLKSMLQKQHTGNSNSRTLKCSTKRDYAIVVLKIPVHFAGA
jgi:hypothetical protein